MSTETKPTFKHDCDRCYFLGEYRGRDLYVCRDTLISRYGDDGPEYSSYLISQLGQLYASWPADHPILEAERRLRAHEAFRAGVEDCASKLGHLAYALHKEAKWPESPARGRELRAQLKGVMASLEAIGAPLEADFLDK